MGKLATLIATGEISAEELVNAQDLIERAIFVEDAINACKQTIVFPLGVKENHCYSYMDSAGEYQAWGSCTNDGVFSCYCNWGGNHLIGTCNLTNFTEIFNAFDDKDFSSDLKRFLCQQIQKSSK